MRISTRGVLRRMSGMAAAALLGATLITALNAAPAHAAGQVTRAEVMATAKRWVDNPVPYSMTSYRDGYRTDCSGFVSMAWGADHSYTTQTLDQIATTISKDQLKPGDALLWKNDAGDRVGHVRLFGGWNDTSHSSYWVYEQTPPRTQRAVYSWAGTQSQYRPIRYEGIVDDAATRSASGLDAVSWGEGRLDVVARSGDNYLIHRYFSAGVWSAWQRVGSTKIASDPSITSWGTRRLDVVARGLGDDLVHMYFNGSGWFTETFAATITSGPEVVAQRPGRLDVVARGGGNQLVHLYYDSGTGGWAPQWDHLGGTLTSDATITSWASGRLDVFAADDKARLVHIYYAAGRWSGWEALSGEDAMTSAPDAAAPAVGRLDIVMRNRNKQLGHVYYSNGAWSAETLGNTLTGAPSITSSSAERLDVFFPDATRTMTQYYHDPAGWHGWVNLGKLPTA